MPKAFETFRVKASLPEELSSLVDLAYNLEWSWNHDAIDLFRRLDGDLWQSAGHNPIRLLGLISQERLTQAAQDEGFLSHLRRTYASLEDYLTRPTWFSERYGKFESPIIAYFSMEFGLTECLPTYSGGLGVLAGDHLKSSSELGIPLVGVGLLYQQGYFRQYLNADGWQQENYPNNDFYNLPVSPVTKPDGSFVHVPVNFPGRQVQCRIWEVRVGRVKLYLLDTNSPENDPRDRKITFQLYGGDNETRIQQELVLGVGGMKALRALGIHVKVCHMNEGHAGFMAFERLRRRREKDKLSTEEALAVVKGGTIFTTHTPVPAGIDVFDQGLADTYLQEYFNDWGLDRESFYRLGRAHVHEHHAPLNMAILALRTTSFANGVSELHGQVSRRMWQSLWPSVPASEVPIDSVTNGTHARSWISKEMAELFSRYLGPDWIRKPANQTIWQKVEEIPDVELWRNHERRRERLVSFTRNRLVEQLKRRGASGAETARAREVLNPEALTIGFARRFATYKRATLLLRDKDRLRELIRDKDRPIQFIFAGKAHPRDNEGKELIKQLVHFSREEDVSSSIVFIENYDMEVARYLVSGVDVWLNNPRRPMEASGTSGMKVIYNGGLNLSILDGWWAEAYEPDVGWAIGYGEQYNDPNYQDEVESKALYDVLEADVVPLFYHRGSDGLPRYWIAKVKQSMIKLGPRFNTNRMVQEYTEKFYMNAYESFIKLSKDNYKLAKNMVTWNKKLFQHWDAVKVNGAAVERREATVGTSLTFLAELHLGKLQPEDVLVEVLVGSLDTDLNIVDGNVLSMECIANPSTGIYKYRCSSVLAESGQFGYSVRLQPNFVDAPYNIGRDHVRWIST